MRGRMDLLLAACVLAGSLACSRELLRIEPPPAAFDSRSVLLMWRYQDRFQAISYDPSDEAPLTFDLPGLAPSETIDLFALAYRFPLDMAPWNEGLVDLSEQSNLCLPRNPSHGWRSRLYADLLQGWTEEHARDIIDRTERDECAAEIRCYNLGPVTSTELEPGYFFPQILEPLDHGGFMYADRAGRFFEIADDESARRAPEFEGLPSYSAAQSPSELWLGGHNGRVVHGNWATGFADEPIPQEADTVIGLSFSPSRERLLAVVTDVEARNRPPVALRFYLRSEGLWTLVGTFDDPDPIDPSRVSVAWNTEEEAYVSYGGRGLCRVTDSQLLCDDRSFTQPAGLLRHREFGLLLAVQGRPLMRLEAGVWEATSSPRLLRKPYRLLELPGGALVGGDDGSLVEIKLNGGPSCDPIPNPGRDLELMTQNRDRIALTGAFGVDEVPLVSFMNNALIP